MNRQISLALASSLIVATTASAQQSSGGRTTVVPRVYGNAVGYTYNDGSRLVLGLSTSSGGARDTLGLLVTSIAPGGPAEKAGLEEGNRLVAISGVALRLNASDATDPEMAGVLGRRLQRELEKAKPGEPVTLGVYANGQTRDVRITPVRADELSPSGMNRARLDTRSTIGASLGGFSSPRDTLGVFVIAVAEDGPLAKAGIFEGSRIASINGVDLRVPAADIGDEFMTSARIRRLSREVEKLEAGANAELRVHANGQYRNVTVKTVKRSDLKRDSGVSIFQYGGSGAGQIPSMGLRLDDGNRLRFEMEHLFDGEVRERIENALRGGDVQLRKMRERWMEDSAAADVDSRAKIRSRSGGSDETMPVQELLKDLQQRLREKETETKMPVRMTAAGSVGDAFTSSFGGTVAEAPIYEAALLAQGGHSMGYAAPLGQAGQTPASAPSAAQGISRGKSSFRIPKLSAQGAAFSVEGIRMSPINANLAGYLGRGSERGLLILEIGDEWTGLVAGDVLLAVDGKSVRPGEGIDVGFDTNKEQCIQLLRDGETVNTVLRRR